MSIKSSARIKKRRAGDPWVSNNRVLTGNATSKNKINIGRNPNFDTDETKMLIQLWGDPKLQRALITTHKKHVVISQLAAKMQDYGYHRSPEEITTRIKNLKCFYNRLKRDMESGLTNSSEPTWKHFAEMDAIMTRPIFSVRPNEVPAPSLKYQLEKAREERAERRKNAQADGTHFSDSDDGLDDIVALDKDNLSKHEIDDGIIPDVEVDIDMNDEAFAAIANAAEQSLKRRKKRKLSKTTSDGDASSLNDLDYDDDDAEEDVDADDSLRIKEEEDSNLSEQEEQVPIKKRKGKTACEEQAVPVAIINEKSAAFIIPKEEPIDVDAEDDSNDKETANSTSVRALMPTLADILQMSKNNMTISPGSVCLPVSDMTTMVATSLSKNLTTTTTTSIAQPMLATSQPGKISLVPTNFLMQPKTTAGSAATVAVTATSTTPTITMNQPQIHLLQNTLNAQGKVLPPRLVLSGGAHVGSAGSQNNTGGIVATGPNGMKVLLVNAEQATGGNMSKNQITTANVLNQGTTVLPLGTALQQQLHQQQQQKIQQHQQQQLKEQQKKQQQQHEQQQQQAQAQKRKQDERQRREELLSKKELTGMRILLRQLLNAQAESNEIQHNRLSLERERLDWEKSTGERLLNILPSLFQQQQNLQQQQQQQTQQLIQQTQAAAQRLNPPKLVFATLPTSGASTATGSNGPPTMQHILTTSNTLTASLPKQVATTAVGTACKPIEICTQINDVQLLAPKLEKED